MSTHPLHPCRMPRAVALLLLGVVVLAGLAVVWAGPAHADPTPALIAAPGPTPNPTPGPAPTSPGAPTPPGVPDPGARPPGAGPSTPPPSAPGNPTPQPIPTPGPSSSSDNDDPAWWDVAGQIRKAVVDLVVWAAKQALQPVMEALGQSWLSTPDLTGNDAVKGIWSTSLVVANAVYVLFIVAGGFLVTARETLQTQHGLKQVLPRLAVGAVAANCSLIICGRAIELTNALTVAIAGNSIDGPSAAAAIRQIVDNALKGDGFLMALLVIAVIVMTLVLEGTFVLRLAALIVLTGLAPAALICHASPLTEGIAYAWWRAFVACLGLQLGQAVIVMATVKVFLTPAGPTVLGIPASGNGLLGVLVCLTMLWLLIKLPGWMRQFILGPLGQSHGRGLIGTLVHAYLMVKTLGAAAGMARGAGTAARAAGTAGRPGTTPRPPGPRPSPTGGPRPRPRPGPSRPSPAGPVAFSHAPATHTPLSAPAGTNAAPTFSHPPSPTTPGPSPTGGAPAAQFSHPSPAQASPPAPAAPAARVAFSDAVPATPRDAKGSPAPAVTFSAAPSRHSAPRRPPAPMTPVFSSAPTSAGPGRTATPATRPTAARRATPAGQAPAAHMAGTGSPRTTAPARSATPPPAPARRATRPSLPPPPAPDRAASPSPPPSPAASPSPVVRAARTASSPPPVRARTARPTPSPRRPRER